MKKGKVVYLNLSILVTSLDMIPTLNEVANEFTRARASKLRRIILLFNEARLSVNHQPEGANFFSPVNRVALAV